MAVLISLIPPPIYLLRFWFYSIEFVLIWCRGGCILFWITLANWLCVGYWYMLEFMVLVLAVLIAEFMALGAYPTSLSVA